MTTETTPTNNPICPYCGGNTVKNGHSLGIDSRKYQRYRCKVCGRSHSTNPLPPGKRHSKGKDPTLAAARAAKKVAKRREARRKKRLAGIEKKLLENA
jgi:transposase-like protein